MQTRVIVNGARGKMGSLACETIKNHPDFELVAALGSQDHLSQSIAETKAEIVIDLTRADYVFENSLAIIESGAHPIIGTSGLIEADIVRLKALCDQKQLGGIIVPNFSIGAVLMMQFAAKASPFFSEVEIIESHHQQKLDAPSGTAIKTAEMIAKSRKKNKNELPLREIIEGARGGTHHQVNIHSIRLPGFLAKQDVIFGSQGETLTLSHNSIDRSCFMPGMLLACKQVKALDSLYYGLEHLLNL
ncbi:4-hydroxy-tetrahydrodipicolinate reductase [Legionella impletisoli]|uniref:4-hydroxy-tetrahydrodipicolinate reductase n=1 Tax=Legionella impletisoli TaxID=343510 RepID=A0A917JV12_9GAMM|nr:4-hydroxy-tetrahydrodipicolinate reductase [Legionella impletisoli]GGI87583.1 4-hydroxy-tetrahydrodipicolinate reductase [Legionella impletisoli]